jgi:hypothetical protein
MNASRSLLGQNTTFFSTATFIIHNRPELMAAVRIAARNRCSHTPNGKSGIVASAVASAVAGAVASANEAGTRRVPATLSLAEGSTRRHDGPHSKCDLAGPWRNAIPGPNRRANYLIGPSPAQCRERANAPFWRAAHIGYRSAATRRRFRNLGLQSLSQIPKAATSRRTPMSNMRPSKVGNQCQAAVELTDRPNSARLAASRQFPSSCIDPHCF